MASHHRRRKAVLILPAVAVSGYGIYRAYHLPSVAAKRRKLFALFETLVSVSESLSSSAETVALISSDLNRFLRSDSDEIPTSLKQVSKIATSDEFVASVSKVSEALTVGIVRGIGSGSGSDSEFTDRVLDKLLSSSGTGFASVVVGSFARNLVTGFCSSGSDQGSGSESLPTWIRFICSESKCRELIADCVQTFVSSAVAVYLEKTMEINTYDEFFAGIVNPNHEVKVKELMISVCNNAVETLIKTTHQVLTDSGSSPSLDVVGLEPKRDELRAEDDRRISFDVKEKDGGGWFNQVSSTLAVPSNRKFVLDVTGRVTFETVKSFLDFLLWKLYDGTKRGIIAVHESVLGRGAEVVRYFSAKTMLILTICLALCLHVLAGTTVLVPA